MSNLSKKVITLNQNVVYKDGKPITCNNTPTNYNKWNVNCRSTSLIDYLRDEYKYSTLSAVYPWATNIRSGFILTLKQDNTYYMFMVQEKEQLYNTDKNPSKIKVLKPRFGFPKGRKDLHDNSFDTAITKMLLETGIDLFDPRYETIFGERTVVFTRELPKIQEVLIYFTATIAIKPYINIDRNILCGYIWVDINSDLRKIKPTTSPTRSILKLISEKVLDVVSY